jgi:hypothetical protein
MSLTALVRTSLTRHLAEFRRDLWLKLLMEAAMIGMIALMIEEAFR